MAEQVHPHTNAPLSVSPLTWSHATLVMTVREYMARRAALNPSTSRRGELVEPSGVRQRPDRR
jgi:hypothetical protein